MIAAVRQHRLMLSLGGAIAIAALLSLTIGSQPLPLMQALQESFGDKPGVHSLILTELRIPRTLVALPAGASLLAGRDGGTLTLILAGVAVNAFALALVSCCSTWPPAPWAAHCC